MNLSAVLKGRGFLNPGTNWNILDTRQVGFQLLMIGY